MGSAVSSIQTAPQRHWISVIGPSRLLLTSSWSETRVSSGALRRRTAFPRPDQHSRQDSSGNVPNRPRRENNTDSLGMDGRDGRPRTSLRNFLRKGERTRRSERTARPRRPRSGPSRCRDAMLIRDHGRVITRGPGGWKLRGPLPFLRPPERHPSRAPRPTSGRRRSESRGFR